MDAILLVLRTGMQWNALNATGICSSSSAHRRFQEWAKAGVFEAFWRQELLAYDELKGIEWEWLSCDGAMGKAPLGGEKTGPNPTDRAKKGRRDRSSATAGGLPIGLEIAGANVNDFKLLRATLESIVVPKPDATPSSPQGLCLDKGYDYPDVYELLDEFGLSAHVRSRGEEKKAARTCRRLPRSPLGRRTHPLLAQPLPRPAHPLVQEARQPPRLPPVRLRPDRLAMHDRDRPTGIGSKSASRRSGR